MAVRCSVEREENGVHEAKFLTCWTCTIVNAIIACKRMRLPTVWSVNNEIARIVKEMQHDTTRIAVKRKHSIRKLYEARRGSATVQGLAECRK